MLTCILVSGNISVPLKNRRRDMKLNSRENKVVEVIERHIGSIASLIQFAVASLYVCYEKKRDELSLIANTMIESDYNSKAETVTSYIDHLKEMNITSDERRDIIYYLFDYVSEAGGRTIMPLSSNSLSTLIYRLLDIKDGDTILDLGSGKGAFLSIAYREAIKEKKDIRLLGEEISINDTIISKMVLDMLEADYYIESGDAIESESIPSFDKGYVYPPFATGYYRTGHCKKLDSIVKGRVTNEWLFVFSLLEKMKEGGRVVALLPSRSLCVSSDEDIRRYLIDNELVEAIISLPRNSLSYTGIEVDALILSNNNKEIKVLDLYNSPVSNKRGGLVSYEVDDIFTKYNDPNRYKIYTKEDIVKNRYNLQPQSFDYVDCYEGLTDLVELSKLVDIRESTRLVKKDFEREILDENSSLYILLPPSLIEDLSFDFNLLLSAKSSDRFLQSTAKKGDILLTNRSTTNKACYIDKDYDNLLPIGGQFILTLKDTDKINPKYLALFLSSDIGNKILSSISVGTAIKLISRKDLEKIKIPCPPLDIQDEIVDEYEKLSIEKKELKKKLNDVECEIKYLLDTSFEK